MTFNDLLYRNNLKKHRKIINYNGNQYEVEYFQKRNQNTIYLYDDFEKETILECKISQLEDLVKDVDNGRKIYSIQKYFKKIMLNVFDGFGYHFSNKANRKNILEKGLFPNGSLGMDTMYASCFLDSKRPQHIPNDFYRQMCVYLYCDIDYSFLKEHDVDEDLYAVNLKDYNWRIGSIGISGFCLPLWSREKFITPMEWDKWRRRYWHNCFSKKDYLSQNKHVKKSNEEYGLDEILVPNHIQPKDITLIGTVKDHDFCYYDTIKDYAVNDFYLDFQGV